MQVYVACAQLKKRVESFMRKAVENKDVRTDLFFYVLMTVGYPLYKRRKLKDLDVNSISEETFTQALSMCRKIYLAHGATDTAAKGPKMVADLLGKLKQRQRSASIRRNKQHRPRPI